MLVVVPCAKINIEWLIHLAIFHGVVHEVEDDILEVHLIDIHRRVDSLNLGIYLTASMLHSERERLCSILHHLVEVEFLLLEYRLLLIKHRHLQHLLYEESQALSLVVDHASEVFHHLLALCNALVVEHLGSKRDAGDRSLELVGHIVYEVVLYLRISLLAEYHHDGEDKGYEQHQCEHHRRYHEADARIDIATHVGEVNLHNAHLVGRVVAEEHLRVGIFYAIASIVRTAVNLATVVGGDGEVIWYVDTIVHQLCLDILVEESEVDAFLQWFLRSLVEDVVNNLVK